MQVSRKSEGIAEEALTQKNVREKARRAGASLKRAACGPGRANLVG